jgi:hypothetical protein
MMWIRGAEIALITCWLSAELDSIITAFSALKVAPDDARGRPDYYLIGLTMGTAVAKSLI